MARLLLGPARVDVDCQRWALHSLWGAATWRSHDRREQRGTYLVGAAFVVPLIRGARSIARDGAGLPPDPGATLGDRRRVFELAAPVVLAAPYSAHLRAA